MFQLVLILVSTTFSHQYHFVNESKSWTEAQRYCRENYTDLATIDNMEEMNRLINTVNSSYSGLAWIGLYDDLDSWRWSLDDDSFYKEGERDFRGWTHQPDNYNGKELCAYMQPDGTWFDGNCQYPNTFVCYNGKNGTNNYIWINQYMTWADAQRYCRELYTDLASVRNLTENQRILNITRGYGVWIGLYRTRLWSDQHSSTYENWRPSIPYLPEQPDNGVNVYGASGNQHCTAVSFSDSGLWTDEDCLAMLPFICYSKFCTGISCVHQYHFVTERKSWTEAQRYCRENYTDLATIDNMEEMNRLINTVNSSYSGLAWIGLYDDLDSWRWSLDDESLYKGNVTTFRNWYIQKPVNSGGNSMCVVFLQSYATWSETYCSYRYPFICYDETASHQYHFVNESKSWTEAQRYCRENYTDLATIDNMEEMNRLINTVNSSYSGLAWIGLYDDLDSWRWSLDDESFYKEGERDFRGWTHQPDNYYGKELCAYMQPDGKWFDGNCQYSNTFVCYDGMNSTYVRVSNWMSWTEAQSYCRKHYTDLASVRNQTELQHILSVSQGYTVWIGLYRNRLWSDQSNSTFTYWNPGTQYANQEPDNGANTFLHYRNQHCTAADLKHSGKWTDENCLVTFPFVCYSGPVAGLRVKVKDEKSLPAAQIEKLVLMQPMHVVTVRQEKHFGATKKENSWKE
ncbi:hypothetical protein NFI96_014284 [Prochilodus magdalenae]|nr:hypothetical protein NFI96_014284 [Prochilodus magdalenae]